MQPRSRWITCNHCESGSVPTYHPEHGFEGYIRECKACKGYGVYRVTKGNRIITPDGKFNGSISNEQRYSSVVAPRPSRTRKAG